jgi:hypothetical protein
MLRLVPEELVPRRSTDLLVNQSPKGLRAVPDRCATGRASGYHSTERILGDGDLTSVFNR